MKIRLHSFSLKSPLVISILLGGLALTHQGLAAPLPDPGVGFEWVLVDSDTHFDSDSQFVDLNSSHAIGGPPTLAGFNSDLTLSTFSPSDELTLHQTAEPGAIFHISVVSSDDEVYRLQLIPEPNVLFTIVFGIGLIVLKRSRR